MLYRIGHKKTFSWHKDFQAHAAVHALHGQRKDSSLSFSHLSDSMLPRLSYWMSLYPLLSTPPYSLQTVCKIYLSLVHLNLQHLSLFRPMLNPILMTTFWFSRLFRSKCLGFMNRSKKHSNSIYQNFGHCFLPKKGEIDLQLVQGLPAQVVHL